MNLRVSTIDEAQPWLRLAMLRHVSPRQQHALLAHFKSPQAILAATPAEIASLTNEAVARSVAAGPNPTLIEKTCRWLEQPGHALVTLADAAYPKSLLQIADPPCVLYARGRIDLMNAQCFAIVGSRNATMQGERDAEAFAVALSDAGFTIASGLALGVDAAAHRGGLRGASSSIAVLGTGPECIYPNGNQALGEQLAAQGLLVSEFPLETPPAPGNFPRRNRLISGLSRGVLVVEAALRSGSLTTAGFALQQDRDVFAIPGSIHSPLSKGCNALIKEGAKLVESADDILSEIAGRRAASGSAQPSISDDETPLERDPMLRVMGRAPVSIDEIAATLQTGTGAVAAKLARFQIEGTVVALPGGLFQRV